MNKYVSWGAAAIAVIALVVAVVGGNSSQPLGAGTRFPNGISTDSTSPSAGQVRGTTYNFTSTGTFGDDATFSGGNGGIVITTTNTATSSIKVGCIDTHATSTATAIRLSATTTPGIAYWSYGTCSGL